MTVRWDHLPAPAIREIAAKPGALAVLPVGSLEQHGPHLPTITDTVSAHETSVAAAEIAAKDIPVVVLPGLWTGMSEHHLPFGGTISLNYAEFSGVIRGIVRSLRAEGFGRLLIVNGHGGNKEPLAVIARECAHEFAMPVVATTPWYAAADGIKGILETAPTAQHACEGEASLMLAILGEHVRTDQFEAAKRQAPPAIEAPDGYSRFWAFSERAPATGTRGDPRPATKAKGEKLLKAMAEALAAAMKDPVLWRTPDPVWTPGRGQGPTVP